MTDPAGGCDQKGAQVHGYRVTFLACNTNLETAIAF